MEEIAILNEEQLSKVSGGVGMPTISTEWYTGPIFVYTIQKKIACVCLPSDMGPPWRPFCGINNIKNPDLIYEGHKLLIPYKG